MNCRFCDTKLTHLFIDLGNAPPSNAFLTFEQLNEPEVFFPLKVYTCHKCFLVQIDEYKKTGQIFNEEYVYFSSYSSSWLLHAKNYVEMMVERFGYNSDSHVIELASNDGYLLQYFLEKGVKVTGIEPTANTAKVAKQKGVSTIVDFFSVKLAKSLSDQKVKADLLLGNNVLAHVPDINDFVGGMKLLLNEHGIITMEFPHLVQLIRNNQFDTIYHEHFSYLSLFSVVNIFEAHGLVIFDVDEIPTHGGSLRIYSKHAEDDSKQISPNVLALLDNEKDAGIANMDYYNNFSQGVQKVKWNFLLFLIEQKKAGKMVAAYGAAAKGNTLLNFCGIKNDFISFVVDANPHKQNKFLPASHIPVLNEEFLKNMKPDYVVIFPWNLKEEIINQLSYIRDWGGKFVFSIPDLQIVY
jgi:hypothetical protein